jgi:hypothetical protein
MNRFDKYTDTDLDNPERKDLTQVVGLLTMPLLHLSAPAKNRQVMQLSCDDVFVDPWSSLCTPARLKPVVCHLGCWYAPVMHHGCQC